MEERRKFNPTKLNRAIEKSGKNVSVLAREAKIPATTLYGWTQGESRPNVESFKAVAKCLKKKMEDLIE